MTLLRSIWDVVRPGQPQHKAILASLTHEQGRVMRALLLLDNPATRDVKAATDSAAEF
jgi:hypothetical protein